ncbi:MAG TPA: HAD-IA family hydrolase [Vicinamibacteria bacterium]|nr:HAD-IA family hydrolase [Vicinamibacteria bacterium]
MGTLVVFDLDGTLVDSSRDIASAANAALQQVAPGTPEIPLPVVIGFVGEGARLLIERSLRHAGLELSVEEVLPVFLGCYRERLLATTRLYEGVADALLALRGRSLAVLTNKPAALSRAILEGLGVSSLFARIWGPEDVPARKPDPAGLLLLLAELGVPPAQAWMVGDSPVDVRTARAASVRVAGALWGLDPAGLRAAEPDRLLSHPRELTALGKDPARDAVC